MTNAIRTNASNGVLAAPAASQVSSAPVSAAIPAIGATTPSAVKSVPRVDPEQMLAQMQEIVDRLNEQMKEHNRNLGFSIDRKINTFVVTVHDSNTGEVVRQIPSEVVVNVAHSLEEMRGLLFNETL